MAFFRRGRPYMRSQHGGMKHAQEVYLCRRVLIAFDPIEGLLCSIENKGRRVVAEEALAHVDNGLIRCRCGLINNGPDILTLTSDSGSRSEGVSPHDGRIGKGAGLDTREEVWYSGGEHVWVSLG